VRAEATPKSSTWYTELWLGQRIFDPNGGPALLAGELDGKLGVRCGLGQQWQHARASAELRA
jgi:hypothetical protein